jgi:hypothetical protein
MYSNFPPTMCQIGKKNPAIEGPLHFVFKSAPPGSNQCKFCKCYAMGATLRCGMTLAVFCIVGVHWKNPQNTSTTIVKILPWPWTPPKRVLNSSVSHPSCPYKPPNLQQSTLPHRTNATGWQELIAPSVLSWLVPGVIQPRPQLVGRRTSLSYGMPSQAHPQCIMDMWN